jgi:UPF0755 protein
MRCDWRSSARRARAFAAAAALGAATACGGSGMPAGAVAHVTIPAGASLRSASDSLAEHGLVSSATLFRWFMRARGGAHDIKAGNYALRYDLSWRELVHALREGEGIENRLTIPEGWSLAQIVPALAQALGAPEDSVDAAARDSTLRDALAVPAATLEGYLFPDTYVFGYGTAPRTAVREMTHRFERMWDPAWDDRLQELAMSRNDIVTLASIIEKEAVLPEERPVISAVYHNRLKRRMALQADPTVQYALGLHRDRVLYRDLLVDSPYNTYKYPGLPPGPIASPGRASLEAALYPAHVSYLYFVAMPDGHHEFRRSYAAHAEAVSAARRARAKQP